MGFEGKSNEWEYDEKKMENDFFKHRLGRKPSVRQILSCIPVLSEEALSRIKVKPGGRGGQLHVRGWNSAMSAMEHEFIKLSNKRDTVILEELFAFDNMNNNESLVLYNITASWDEAKRTGKFDVQLYLKEGVFGRNYRSTQQKNQSFTRLLGSWYDIFPL